MDSDPFPGRRIAAGDTFRRGGPDALLLHIQVNQEYEAVRRINGIGLHWFPRLTWGLIRDGHRRILEIGEHRWESWAREEHQCPEAPDQVDVACVHEEPLSYAVAWLESNGWDLEEESAVKYGSRTARLSGPSI